MTTTTDVTGTPQDARRALHELVDAVERATGVAWIIEDSPSPVGCQRTPDTAGVAFTATRTTPDVLPESAAADVASLLAERGMEVGRRDAFGFVSVLGVHPVNRAFTLELRVFAESAMIVAQSACVIGDVWDELQRVKREVAESGTQ
jgi:hypothetical protein